MGKKGTSRGKAKQGQPKTSRKLFKPSEVATLIEDAITRDLSVAAYEYAANGTPSCYGQYRQIVELKKKFYDEESVDTEALKVRTFEKFLGVNGHLATVDLDLPSEIMSGNLRDQTLRSKILYRARALMHRVLTPFTIEEWYGECRNSSGSTVGVSFVDCSPEAKLTFPISLTEDVKPLMESYFAWDSLSLQEAKKYNSFQPARLPMYETVLGSRASTVDKNAEIRRMICIEPTGNMFFQQGLMQMMYTRMGAFGLNVETLPTLHKQRARLGSITGNDATIDWSSASDCTLIELLRWLSPPKWFDACMRTRSPVCALNGDWVSLNMFATMGNAVTFPLETLVFWTLAQAVRLTAEYKGNSLHPEWEDLSRCSVFGDDCIVPSSIATDFVQMLESVGFLLNTEKSFWGTSKREFRESCGGDFLSWQPCRPFSLRPPSSNRVSALEPWLYIISNSLLKKYVQYFGGLSYLYDKELWRVIVGLFVKWNIRIKLIPQHFPDDAGLKLVPDWDRFILAYQSYGITVAKVRRLQDGTYSFNFCRFKYWQERAKFEGIRLAMWLKKPYQSKRRIPYLIPKREKGGYVEARAISHLWY